jgi:hypothetical protein
MRKMVWAALCAAGMMAAGQASATVIVETFSGTVASGADQLGLFGAAGADLAGKSFTATATFDTDVGALAGVVNPGFNASRSGSFFGIANVLQNVSFTIGGANWQPVGLNFQDQAEVDFYSLRGHTFAEISFFERALDGSIVSFSNGTGVASYAANTLTITSSPGQHGGGQINLAGMDHSIEFNTEIATATPLGPAAVLPEPDAWALMILGFAGAGAALRRRRMVAS